jgi:hypothetical protein
MAKNPITQNNRQQENIDARHFLCKKSSMGKAEIKSIEDWLKASGMKESRLGLLAAANPRAIERIRSGDAKIKTLDAVLAYIKANPVKKRRGP